MATLPLCTLDQMKYELKSTASGNVALSSNDYNEQALKNNSAIVAARIAKLGFEFAPRIETLDILITSDKVDSGLNLLTLPRPLLVLQGVTIGSTTLTVGTNVTTYPTNTPYPYRQLRLIWSSVNRGWYSYCPPNDGDPLVASITGIWGYKERYSTTGWLAYDTLAAAINASVTSITVADADGLDPTGNSPRFSPGQLIQIDTEWLQVTAVNTTTNVLTVRRAQQGSTAAAHLINATISSWQVEEDILRVAIRQSCMLYARRGAFQVSEISDLGTIQYPADLLAELHDTLGMYYL